MKLLLFMVLLSTFVFSCSAKVEDHAAATPEFDLYGFFEGKTKAWGMVQDYSGKQIRRFEVTIVGTIGEDGKLVLDEDFVYDDGEIQNRVWTISKQGDKHYIGLADDVIGEAHGRVSGNALNWQYTLRVQTANGEIDLFMDDWMFRHNDKHLFNVTTMKKLGVSVGRITLFFEKQDLTQASVEQSVFLDEHYRAYFAAIKPVEISGELESWKVLKGNQSTRYGKTVPASRMF